MNVRSISISLVAGLLAATAYAQTANVGSKTMPPVMDEIRMSNAVKKEAHSAARIEVTFSGSQSDRFVFDESAGSVFQHKGLAMRAVGMGDIEMGARKTRVGVMREDAKPEMFHTHFDTAGGGKLDAVLSLQVGEAKTVSLVGGKPTKVTVKRIR